MIEYHINRQNEFPITKPRCVDLIGISNSDSAAIADLLDQQNHFLPFFVHPFYELNDHLGQETRSISIARIVQASESKLQLTEIEAAKYRVNNGIVESGADGVTSSFAQYLSELRRLLNQHHLVGLAEVKSNNDTVLASTLEVFRLLGFYKTVIFYQTEAGSITPVRQNIEVKLQSIVDILIQLKRHHQLKIGVAGQLGSLGDFNEVPYSESTACLYNFYSELNQPQTGIECRYTAAIWPG